MFRLVSSFFFLLLVFPAFAFTVDVPVSDPVLEARAQSLFHEIRCMVCQGQAIADSNASVASDMRADIRKQIVAGVSDDNIKAGLAAQYGDVILMKPPLKNSTVLLWFGPWLVLFLGMVATYFYFRKPPAHKAP